MSNIADQILFLEREYRDREQGRAGCVIMSHEDYATLREELGVDITHPLDVYHGMTIVVEEDAELRLEAEGDYFDPTDLFIEDEEIY